MATNTIIMATLRIIRPNELSRILGISTVTIWRWEKEGKLPSRKKIGDRAVGWKESDIEDWIDNCPNALEVEGV